jgi:hypothetical protein
MSLATSIEPASPPGYFVPAIRDLLSMTTYFLPYWRKTIYGNLFTANDTVSITSTGCYSISDNWQ